MLGNDALVATRLQSCDDDKFTKYQFVSRPRWTLHSRVATFSNLVLEDETRGRLSIVLIEPLYACERFSNHQTTWYHACHAHFVRNIATNAVVMLSVVQEVKCSTRCLGLLHWQCWHFESLRVHL